MAHEPDADALILARARARQLLRECIKAIDLDAPTLEILARLHAAADRGEALVMVEEELYAARPIACPCHEDA
jgi:hypothetical protein